MIYITLIIFTWLIACGNALIFYIINKNMKKLVILSLCALLCCTGMSFKANDKNSKDVIGVVWENFDKIITSMNIDKKVFKNEEITVETPSPVSQIEEVQFVYINSAVASLQKLNAHNAFKVVEWLVNPCGLPPDCTSLDTCWIDRTVQCNGIYYTIYYCYVPGTSFPYQCSLSVF